jgi:hypothetical protein
MPWTREPSVWTSASTATNQYVNISTTWDTNTAAPRAIVWDGSQVVMGPPYQPAPPMKETAVDWLRRRVQEYRVPLMEAA